MHEQIPVPSQYLRLPEAAKYIHMSPQFLRRAHREGRGPDRIRVSGKVILFARAALDSWLLSQKDESAARTA